MAGWSDYYNNWEDEDALALADEYKLLEAVTLAVNERSVFVGLAELSIAHLTTTRDKVAALNTRVKQLIPLFGRIVDGEYKAWTESEIKNYGTRPDGSLKGLGYFGEIYMTTGEYDFATEISIEASGILMPSIVPTLTDAEVRHLLAGGSPFEGDIPQKALAHATQRIAHGLKTFARDGEQSPRPWMPGFTSPLVTTRKWIRIMYEVINKLLLVKGNVEFRSDMPGYSRNAGCSASAGNLSGYGWYALSFEGEYDATHSAWQHWLGMVNANHYPCPNVYGNISTASVVNNYWGSDNPHYRGYATLAFNFGVFNCIEVRSSYYSYHYIPIPPGTEFNIKWGFEAVTDNDVGDQPDLADYGLSATMDSAAVADANGVVKVYPPWGEYSIPFEALISGSHPPPGNWSPGLQVIGNVADYNANISGNFQFVAGS